MYVPLLILLVITGIVFITSVLLQSPKGGVGMGIGGASAAGNEYGSRKTMENKLKKVALISGILFVIIVIFLPYLK